MKKPIIQILILTTALVTISLSCNRKKEGNQQTTSDQVVLIFHNPPSQRFFYFNSGSYGGIADHETIRFIGKGNLYKNYTPDHYGDTIDIPCYGQKHIIVSHLYKGIEIQEFLLCQGDSIDIIYDQTNFPILRSRTSNDLTFAYNLKNSVKGRTANFSMEPTTILGCYDFVYAYLARNNPQDIFYSKENFIDFDSLYLKNDRYYINFKRLLDSSEANKLLEPAYLDFYRQRLEWIQLQGKIKPEERISKINQPKDNEMSKSIVINDSLVFNYTYQGLLNYYVHNEAKKNGVATIIVAQGRFPDFRTVFDNIANDTTLPPKSRAILLAICLNSICSNFGLDDKQQYFKKFLALTNDTVKANILQKRWNLYFSNSDNLILVDADGLEMTFDEAIKKYTGKVIYLDFWAPWCSPCREEMVNAEKLHTLFKGKDLVFMNVVIWDTDKNWEKIKPKFEKNHQIVYYFAKNSQTSRQLEKLKVDLIPHFMVFDRNGLLVIQKAKRPKDPGVFQEIEKYL